MPHVFVAGLVHETHTFLSERTGLDAFEHTLWLRGEAMLARCDGDASPMGGALEVATARGWQVYPSRYGAAMPSGTVTDDVLETWWDDVQQDLSAALTEGIDGILLILHGAMPFQGFADGEGEILRRISRVLTDRLGRGPIGLVEPSDNIGGGTPGDGTGILAAFLRYEVDNAVVVINDPAVAAACHEVSEGDRLQLSIGAKLDRFHGDPMALEVKLENLTDGRFTLENEKSHLASLVGRHVDMGPSAVVRHQGVRILLTTYKTPPMDLGQLRSQGIVPEDLHMVGIKAAVAHRAAYDPILAKTYYVDTPGLGSSDLRRFSFQNIPRPMAPLD